MTSPAVLVVAMLLDAVFGEPDWLWKRLPHPAALMGRLIDHCDHHLNIGQNRKARGIACMLALALAAGGLGSALSLLGPMVEIVIVAVLIAQKSLMQHVAAVAEGLRISVFDGRKAVALIVSRDASALTDEGVARSAIESAAENMSDGVVAPIFWFLAAGLPGLLIYKMTNTADSMIGYRTPRHKDFGWAAARFDDVLNIIPARLTALFLMIIGSVTDLSGVRLDAGKHKSPNAGWPEAALSRALGIALAGPRTYNGALQHFPWVNPTGRKHLTAVDIDETISLLWKVWGLILLLLIALTLFV